MQNMPIKCCAGIILFSLFLIAFQAHAGKVVLRIRAGNPIEKAQTVQIKSNLPLGIRTNDIISLDGLELGYDIKNDIYYVYKEMKLGPKEITVFKVEVNDIWVIPAEEIDMLRKRAVDLVDKLRGREHHETADALRQEIEKNLGQIQANQTENAIRRGVKAMRHIRAYETNLKALKKVKTDIGYIENLVLGSGQDPGGRLVGEVKDAPKPQRDVELAPEEYRTAIYKITIYNPSPNETRKIPSGSMPSLKRYLPPEIKFNDILDAGGLEIGVDRKKGACYLYKETVEIAPTSTVTFVVKIRDKWNINMSRIEPLKSKAGAILEIVTAKGAYHSIEEMLNNLITRLEEIEKESGPETLDDKYVAFYRRQADRIDIIEQKINRIRAALRPPLKTTQLGFRTKAPTMKTTWGIIYFILGFLTVMSLLFFLRWMGKTKEERMGGGGS